MEVMSGKRSAEEVIPLTRRTRIRLASPSPERTSESDTESIHSWQGYKTELANDTSETSSSIHAVSLNEEFEPTDIEEHKLRYYISDDSIEDVDFQLLSDVYKTISNDSLDKALLGDTSEEISTSPTSNSDVDPGLPRNDYLDFEKCLLCQTDKKNISYPYCSTCFTWKKNLFPSRPKKRKKNTTPVNQFESLNRNIYATNHQSNKNVITLSQNSNKDSNLSEGLFEDSGMGSTEPQMSEDTVDGPSQPSTSSSVEKTNPSNLNTSEICRVCFSRPENGLFIHSNSAHLYGCYNCAKEIWYHKSGCPICRRKVFKVSKLYV